MWDRSKQKHWINTHGEVWEVLDFKTNEHVCVTAPILDTENHNKICFLDDVEEIKKLSKQSFEEFEKQKIFFDMVEKSRRKH